MQLFWFPNYRSKDDIAQNVLQKYSMVFLHIQLSDQDKKMIADMYPKTA
jgi:hypothetical protein